MAPAGGGIPLPQIWCGLYGRRGFGAEASTYAPALHLLSGLGFARVATHLQRKLLG